MSALHDFHYIHDTGPFIALVTRRVMPYIPQYSIWLSLTYSLTCYHSEYISKVWIDKPGIKHPFNLFSILLTWTH